MNSEPQTRDNLRLEVGDTVWVRAIVEERSLCSDGINYVTRVGTTDQAAFWVSDANLEARDV